MFCHAPKITNTLFDFPEKGVDYLQTMNPLAKIRVPIIPTPFKNSLNAL